MRVSWMIAALLIAGLSLAEQTRAQQSDWGLVINGKAIHVNSSYDWNEHNWGLGFEREFDSQARWVKVALGNGFVDSMNAMSYMGGGGLKRRFHLPGRANGLYVDLGAVGFLMSRKDINAYRPFPGVLPTVTIGSRQLAVNIAYLPGAAADAVAGVYSLDPGMDAIFFVQVRVNPRVFAPRGLRLRPTFANRR